MKQSWNIKSIYPTDEAFHSDVELVKKGLEGDINALQEAAKTLQQLESYVECLMAEDTENKEAYFKNGIVRSLLVRYESALFQLGKELAKDDQCIKKHPEIQFFLEELRDFAKAKGRNEELINALSADGYHSFWSLYQMITGKIRIGDLSVSQAQNLLSHADRKVRLKAFEDWQSAWKAQADVIGQILNHLGGFRLQIYEARGWEDILFEPLFLNRMEKETFNAMWEAIEEAKPAFLRFLATKAKLLGLEKLSWSDVEAPIGELAESAFESTANEIITMFDAFYPKMGDFAKEAFKKEWIEAEDREGKAAGGFCVFFPKTEESRIFMTYKGTPHNVATLAHELGHAYHNECVKHLPYFAQILSMNVAETASTFAEMVVIDRAIALSKSKEGKRKLLDDKLQRSIAYFMNLQARLMFEQAFYEERKKGLVPVARLCELMEKAQREAFCDSLASYDPYFWASKLHFYCTHFPFYNFPYTFGYLMSNGLYARAKEGNFGQKLDAFLEDTGQMHVEALAKKHLDVDLTSPQFWRESIKILLDDVETFIHLGS